MSNSPLIGLARRERRGSDKRKVGIKNALRMLPKYPIREDKLPENTPFADSLLMSLEDSYCDTWDRTEVVDARTRSLFTVAMMIAVGNVGNQFELEWHSPGAIHNGATFEEVESVLTYSRKFVGGPAQGQAQQTIRKSLESQGLMPKSFAAPDLERREKTGSEKRKIAREVLQELDPNSPLLAVPEEIVPNKFGSEIDLMILENYYYDSWARKDVFDRRMRSIVTLGFLFAIPNHDLIREHVPIALKNGVTVAELEELVYHASIYLGFPAGLAIRKTVSNALQSGGL